LVFELTKYKTKTYTIQENC